MRHVSLRGRAVYNLQPNNNSTAYASIKTLVSGRAVYNLQRLAVTRLEEAAANGSAHAPVALEALQGLQPLVSSGRATRRA